VYAERDITICTLFFSFIRNPSIKCILYVLTFGLKNTWSFFVDISQSISLQANLLSNSFQSLSSSKKKSERLKETFVLINSIWISICQREVHIV